MAEQKYLKIFAFFVVLLVCSSCITTLALTGIALSNMVPGEKVTIKGYTTERIGDSNQCALMETDSGETICIVYDFGTYKDGKRIKDRFVRAGLYRYFTDNGAERYVPIFIRKKDYKRLWPIAVELNVNQPDNTRAPEVYI